MNIELLTHNTYMSLARRLQSLQHTNCYSYISSAAFLYAIDNISTDCYAIGGKLAKCKHLGLVQYEDKFKELYRECIRTRSAYNPYSIANKKTAPDTTRTVF